MEFAEIELISYALNAWQDNCEKSISESKTLEFVFRLDGELVAGTPYQYTNSKVEPQIIYPIGNDDFHFRSIDKTDKVSQSTRFNQVKSSVDKFCKANNRVRSEMYEEPPFLFDKLFEIVGQLNFEVVEPLGDKLFNVTYLSTGLKLPFVKVLESDTLEPVGLIAMGELPNSVSDI